MIKRTILLMMIGLLSCSPVRVSIDYDSQADFSNYKAYKIMKFKSKSQKGSWINNSLNLKRMDSAIRDELNARNFTESGNGKADFFVAYHIGVQKKVDVSYYGYHYRRGWYGGGGRQVRRYKEGTLIIDIVDANSKEMIWRGVGEGAIRDLDDAEGQIREAVKAILEKFPPNK